MVRLREARYIGVWVSRGASSWEMRVGSSMEVRWGPGGGKGIDCLLMLEIWRFSSFFEAVNVWDVGGVEDAIIEDIMKDREGFWEGAARRVLGTSDSRSADWLSRFR